MHAQVQVHVCCRCADAPKRAMCCFVLSRASGSEDVSAAWVGRLVIAEDIMRWDDGGLGVRWYRGHIRGVYVS